MSAAVAERHLRASVMSMSGPELTLFVYDLALTRLECIRELGPQAPWEELRPHLMAAQQAVTALLECVVSPRAAVAPEVQEMAGNLRSLYLWAIQTLVQSDIHRSFPPVEDLQKVLGNLADGWRRGVLGR